MLNIFHTKNCIIYTVWILLVIAEKLYSRFILCFSNVSILLLGFTIFGKFTSGAEFQSITRSRKKTVDETRDPMGWLIESPFRNGPWIPKWAHLLQQSVLEQSFHFSDISWTDSNKRTENAKRASLKFRFETWADAVWLDIIRLHKAYGWLWSQSKI